jgi:broad specificity phosphatase PhoE
VTGARILLIRHAESQWNAAGRWQGHGDPPLSARGRQQADALAGELAGQGIDVLVSSDLARARETAAALARALGLVCVHDARFRELDVGAWTGLSREEIERRDPERLARFDAGDPDAPAGGAETRAQIRRRVRTAAAGLAAAHPARCVALVTHLGVIRALLPGAELRNGEWRLVAADALAAPDPGRAP